MLILVDNRIPAPVKDRLRSFGDLLEFGTSGITYAAISGHPDIFFCQTPFGLVVAPNTPAYYLEQLDAHQIQWFPGRFPVGEKYPRTSPYNAVVSQNVLIHALEYTDPVIRDMAFSIDSDSGSTMLVNVKQGYTRCNLILLNTSTAITSDKGIEKVLKSRSFEVLFVSPESILLPGFANGFFGGCCGIHENQFFISGSLKYHPEGVIIRNYLQEYGISTIELYEGPLFDGGGIFFLKSNRD